MENEKLFGFIRRRGTLGILTLVLVGIVAFASYRTSYPVTTETERTEAVKEASGTGAQQKNVQNPLQEYQNTRETGTVSAQKNDVSAGSVSEDVTAGTLEEAAAAGSGEVTANGKNTDTAEKSIKAAEVKTEAETEKETEEADPVVSGSVISPTVQFSEDTTLSWPAAGTILMDYSMDGTVYFKTLNEYKYNPALIIGSEVGNPVVASARGIVENIAVNEETGTTLTTNIGNDYELIYGELKEVAVSEGEVVEQGQLLGYVSEPTKYYCEEGSNLYFAMKKDGQIVDPCLYLE